MWCQWEQTRLQVQETWDVGSILSQEDPLEEEMATYSSILENPMDTGAWQAIVHRVTQSQTRLKGLSKHHENYTKKASNRQTFKEPK